ncbi:MAG: IclR family transcriptional regulator, partial [Vulcanimicrobiaceae bacterium]
ETARLHVLVNLKRVCAAEIETLYEIRATGGVGKTYELTSGAASKAILAFQPEAAIDLVLVDLPQANGTKVRAELAKVRKQGFATSVEENARGAASLAAPVRDRSGGVVAALCVTGPTSRWAKNNMLMFTDDIVRCANELSQQLHHPK